MTVIPTAISGVLLLEPTVFADDRGGFFESFNHRRFAEATGATHEFVQDNHSFSRQDVLRGLHYQIRQAQGKLVRAVVGEVFDVAVDLRRSSPTFGQWVSAVLSAANRRQMWVPVGCAHGFLVTSDHAEVIYKTTDYYAPAHERIVRWDDPDLSIRWPIVRRAILAPRDLAGARFADAELFP